MVSVIRSCHFDTHFVYVGFHPQLRNIQVVTELYNIILYTSGWNNLIFRDAIYQPWFGLQHQSENSMLEILNPVSYQIIRCNCVSDRHW